MRLVNASKVAQVPVHQTATGLGLAYVDQIILESVVEVVGNDCIALKQASFDPADLAAALLVHQQPRAELLGFNLKEAC